MKQRGDETIVGESGSNMITLEDCIAFCILTKEEVLAIAEREQLP